MPSTTIIPTTMSPYPAKAIGWARRIGDAELRVESLTAVGKRWFRADPQAARAWLAESELPEEARRAVLETPPQAEAQGR